MEPATFADRDSDAMLVDANDGPTASKPQYNSHHVKRGFPKPARGLMLSNRNLQMGSIVPDSRPPIPSPNRLNPASHSPTMMKTFSPTPNYHQNTSVFPPKRKITQMFEGAFETLERVINRTRKRERVSDDFGAQIVGGNSSQYDLSVESVTPQPPTKIPRRDTPRPSPLLFEPPGLQRRLGKRPVASPPNLNPPIYSSQQPSILGHTSRPAISRPDDHKKREYFRTNSPTHRSSMANSSTPPKLRLSTLKDIHLPSPFNAYPQAANQPQFDQTMGDETIAVLPSVPPQNVLSNATGAPIVKPTPMALPVCSNPESLYYDGEEPMTRCESPEQIPGYYDYDDVFSDARPCIGYSIGGLGNRYIRQGSIYADPYAMDVVTGREN